MIIPINSIVDFLKEYLKNKPFTDLLMLVGIGVFLWMESEHGKRADHAHSRVKEILAARDEAEEKRAERDDERTDKIIAVLTGVKQEVKKNTAATREIPAATAKAAAAIVGGAADKPE